MKMTYHAMYERMERINYIIDNVGIGNVILEHTNEKGNLERITDTGVLLVCDTDRTTLITAFVLTTEKAYNLFKAEHRPYPCHLEKRIKANHKYIKFCNPAYAI